MAETGLALGVEANLHHPPLSTPFQSDLILVIPGTSANQWHVPKGRALGCGRVPETGWAEGVLQQSWGLGGDRPSACERG